jgi:sugar transferase EpsL
MPIKRLFDICITILLLVVMAPIILVVAILVAACLGWPVFFVQTRAGQSGRPFKILKFRTMTSKIDETGRLLPDDQRLTTFGKLLRSTSMDELPELWNVLIGDMSLVGPRPLHVHYLMRYSVYHHRRHEVRPGITGWAQVNGRNALNWDSRLDLDVWYVDNWSFWLDIRVLWMTVVAVFSGKDISAEGHATMPEFMGSKER